VSPDVALIYSHGRRLVPGEPVTGVVWLSGEAAFTLGDGSVQFATLSGPSARHAAHEGAILCAARAPDGAALLTGGDDGKLRRVAPDGETAVVADFGAAWVDHVAASPVSGAVVAGVGREAVIWLTLKTERHAIAFPSTVGGVALDGKGKRLAVTHYNGATLCWLKPGTSKQVLRWDGSHLACTLSPDGGYLVTALQETGLHGWKLPMAADMRMSGYGAKTKSFSWSKGGRWLATSGDARAIVWPFVGPTGPMGKGPKLIGPERSRVTRVAFHPREEMLAIGYADGSVALASTEDERGLEVDEPGGEITALGWSDDGQRLAWGDEDGRAGLLDMAKRG
jgi:WD40 repeat protein